MRPATAAAVAILTTSLFVGKAAAAGAQHIQGVARQHSAGEVAPHVTRIVLLGTKGGPSVSASRAEPANLLIVDGAPYLIDAGEGVSRQLSSAGYPPREIHTIFITHQHVDHNAGLVALMSSSWFERAWGNERSPAVQIYGPPATAFLVGKAVEYLSVSERIFRSGVPQMPRADSMFIAHDIDRNGVVLQNRGMRVTAIENTHFLEASHGLNGIRDRSYSYRFDTAAGSVVFTGDTGPSSAVTRLARGADVLVSEACADDLCGKSGGAPAATNPSGSLPMAMAEEERNHMLHEHLTPEEVGEMAEEAHVGMVIVTHLVYLDTAGGESAEVPEFTAGVRRYYSGPVIVGRDLFEYDLVRSSSSKNKP